MKLVQLDAGSAPLSFGPTGVVNGVGFDAHQSWAFARAEVPAWYESPFRCDNGERATMSFLRTLPPTLFGDSRLVELSLAALGQLVEPIRRCRGKKVALVCALPSRYGTNGTGYRSGGRQALERAWSRFFAGAGLEDVSIAVEARGHAGLARALERGVTMLSEKMADVVIAGGADTYYDADVVDDLLFHRRLFDLENHDSFIPGEGAAFLVLAPADMLRALDLEPRLGLEAIAHASEPAPMLGEAPCAAVGLSQCFRGITDTLRRQRRKLDWLLGDLTNEQYRAHEFQLAFPRLMYPGGLDDAGVGAREVASDLFEMFFLPTRYGDLGAATMPTALAFAAEAMYRQATEADTAAVFGSSVGEDRGAVLVSRRRRAS